MMLFLLVLYLTAQLSLVEVKEVHVGSSLESMNMPVTTSTESLVPSARTSNDQSLGSGISCYVCNSKNDSSCFDEKNLRKEHIQKCEPVNGKNSIGCWRIEQWVSYDISTELKAHDRVIRTCAYRKQEHPCIYRSGFGSLISHCLCNSTVCNGSMIITPTNTFLLFFSTLFSIFAIKSFT